MGRAPALRLRVVNAFTDRRRVQPTVAKTSRALLGVAIERPSGVACAAFDHMTDETPRICQVIAFSTLALARSFRPAPADGGPTRDLVLGFQDHSRNRSPGSVNERPNLSLKVTVLSDFGLKPSSSTRLCLSRWANCTPPKRPSVHTSVPAISRASAS